MQNANNSLELSNIDRQINIDIAALTSNIDMSIIPHDIWIEIFTYLDIDDLLRLRQANRIFQAIADISLDQNLPFKKDTENALELSALNTYCLPIQNTYQKIPYLITLLNTKKTDLEKITDAQSMLYHSSKNKYDKIINTMCHSHSDTRNRCFPILTLITIALTVLAYVWLETFFVENSTNPNSYTASNYIVAATVLSICGGFLLVFCCIGAAAIEWHCNLCTSNRFKFKYDKRKLATPEAEFTELKNLLNAISNFVNYIAPRYYEHHHTHTNKIFRSLKNRLTHHFDFCRNNTPDTSKAIEIYQNMINTLTKLQHMRKLQSVYLKNPSNPN